jgi:hypothetical protein
MVFGTLTDRASGMSEIPPPKFALAQAASGYDRALVRTLPGKALLGVRFTLGPASWLMPKFTILAIGGDPHSNPQAAYWARLFGIRDIALGVGLLSTSGDARRLWWRLGMMCDLGDAISGLLSNRNNELPTRPRVLAPGYAVAGVVGAALGAAALLADDV